ncbi:MAG: uroporphyrinogen decarboxylase family protein [Anaerolineae bacterium]|nr:uroporphyrinogen decarboxylase family protein [Anaerolineae bacterium]
MGFPGIQVNGSSLKQNEFNWSVQFWTLFELVRRFQPDGMFTFMDLSVEANALGLPVRFPLDESPSVEYPVVEVQADLRRFYKIDVLADGRLHVFVETMRMMQRHLSMMRGGYVIGPYTLAALMMGATEAAIATIDNPDLLHETLRLTTHVITRYANALARAGAHVIAILEPSAVMLSPRQFRQYSGEYVKQIIEKMSAQPVLHICGNTNHLIDGMIATGAQGLSLDSLVDLPAIAADVPEDVVLIGNVSPTAVMVDETPAGVYATTRDLIERMAPYPNFILSTGCDLPPETPLANIQAFMDAGRGRPLCEREDGCIPLDETLFKERPEKILSTIVEAWR